MRVVIIDYGAGNLFSVCNALNYIKNKSFPDLDVIVSNHRKYLATADAIILPGVGAYADCYQSLSSISEFIPELERQIFQEKKKFLGICVGMQLLSERGTEQDGSQGMGWFKGDVVSLRSRVKNVRIPHIGWNNIEIQENYKNHRIFKGIENFDVYFVHSYFFDCKEKDVIVACTNYGIKFPSLLIKDNIVTMQFHPEKSSQVGLKLLENFLLM